MHRPRSAARGASRLQAARDAVIGGAAPATLVSASRLSMGSTLTLTAWTADEPAAKAAFDEVFAEFTRLEKLMSTWIRRQRRLARQSRGRRAARAGERGGARGAEDRAADERVDGRKVRRHVRRAVRPLEVRSRPGQRHPRHARGAHAASRSSTIARFRSMTPRARCSWRARACRCTSAASARATRSIARAAILRRRGLRDFMVQSGGDIYVAGTEGWTPLAARHPGSARSRESHLRRARSHGRHIQHIRRLRAVFREERPALSPHSRSRDRRARARRAQRHDRRRTSPCSPTVCRPASSSWAPRPAWRSSSGCPTSKG